MSRSASGSQVSLTLVLILGLVAAVAEPIAQKRTTFGKRYIWHANAAEAHQQFTDWREYVAYETSRRKHARSGVTNQVPAIDAACICTLDTQHVEIILALVPLGLHILSEKPLATTLQDCLAISRSLSPSDSARPQSQIFGIGHVLRYSPHNLLLRKLLLNDRVVGDILSVEHTEPIGWWHFSHSYVRGNWRREDTTAPSLLTKSCHDIDLLLWLLCSPPNAESHEPPHLPSTVSSTGQLSYFKKSRKPAGAGKATNCLRCPMERECNYSAKKIYVEKHLQQGKIGWPVDIVEPEIEELFARHGPQASEKMVMQRLAENYDARRASPQNIRSRNWFGRCAWESDNDVCDDQTVTITWEDNYHGDANGTSLRLAKTATFHQIAHTEAQCARRGRVYGSHGEITYDSQAIRVFDFATSTAKGYQPTQTDFNDPIAKHGGGDTGLTQQFVAAVSAVKNGTMSAERAQKHFLGCTPEEILRSHAMVFAAEEARVSKTVVDWHDWWKVNVEGGPSTPKVTAQASNTASGTWEMVDVASAED